MKPLLACLMLIALAGCVRSSGADAWCLANAPRRFTDAELVAMSPEQSREAVAYNMLGIERCNWK